MKFVHGKVYHITEVDSRFNYCFIFDKEDYDDAEKTKIVAVGEGYFWKIYTGGKTILYLYLSHPNHSFSNYTTSINLASEEGSAIEITPEEASRLTIKTLFEHRFNELKFIQE